MKLPPIGTATVLRADARNLPLADNSVDLIITSPPYFALRSYTDGGQHYDGQIGAEPTPAEFLDALIEVTRECVRVLKPTGSLWVNLGDKYAGVGGSNGHAWCIESDSTVERRAKVRVPLHQGRNAGGVRSKSLYGIPWRYALRCIDDLGLILRAEIIWSKPNGLPESVTDRVRRSHEQWFHMTRQPRYFAAVDEIREGHVKANLGRVSSGRAFGAIRNGDRNDNPAHLDGNPLGKLPGSVREVATEPLHLPEWLGVDHFAAFPTAWPRWIVQGWSPRGVCVACGEGRRPVVARDRFPLQAVHNGHTTAVPGAPDGRSSIPHGSTTTITGYACACPDDSAPTTPATVLDPFGGTGTTAMVAKALGRHGISVDLSADYCRAAEWRVNDPQQLAKVRGIRDYKPPQQVTGQADLLGLLDEDGAA